MNDISDINLKTVAKLNIIKDEQPITFAHSVSHETSNQHILHINHFYEIYVLVQGDTDYIVGNSYFSLKPGDIIIINPYEVHKAVLKSSALYERFYFLVPENIFSSFRFDPMQKFKSPKSSPQNLIRLSDENREKALHLLYEMFDVLEKDSSATSQLYIYGQFLQFLTLINHHDTMNLLETSEHDAHQPRHIKEILSYINDNLTKLESVEEIADNLGISLPYLSSTFKNAIGTPISKYIQTRKIAYAKTLLDDGASVTDTCFNSGFNDCAYFIKTFKQHTGMTPLQYRKSRI